MKNLLRVIPFIAIIACQPPASDEADDLESFEIIDTQPSMYAVSLAEAKKNIEFYDTLAKKEFGFDPIKAFTIRSVDLAEAIGLPTKYLSKADYRHVRIYMGLDSASQQFKIYLTPVEGAKLSKGKAGKDVILSGPYKGDGELADGDGPYLMDFSAPCPKTCPEGGL